MSSILAFGLGLAVLVSLIREFKAEFAISKKKIKEIQEQEIDYNIYSINENVNVKMIENWS